MKASEVNKDAMEVALTAIQALNQSEWDGLKDEVDRQFAIVAEKNTLGGVNSERIIDRAVAFATLRN